MTTISSSIPTTTATTTPVTTMAQGGLAFFSSIFVNSHYFLANVNSCSRSLYVVVRPSVCRPSVCRLSSETFVHPTQPIEIFGNVSAPFNTLLTWCHPGKILRRSSKGNPSVGGLNQRVVENVAILDLFEAISRKRCKIGGKLLLITNRKSHMGFRLVPKSATLNDLERRNGRYIALFHWIW